MGIPLDQKGESINEHCKLCNIPVPQIWDKIRLTDVFGFIQKYLKVTYIGTEQEVKEQISSVLAHANEFLIVK